MLALSDNLNNVFIYNRVNRFASLTKNMFQVGNDQDHSKSKEFAIFFTLLKRMFLFQKSFPRIFK